MTELKSKILACMQAEPSPTVDQIAEALREPKQAVKAAMETLTKKREVTCHVGARGHYTGEVH